jgi:hypothetical protein
MGLFFRTAAGAIGSTKTGWGANGSGETGSGAGMVLAAVLAVGGNGFGFSGAGLVTGAYGGGEIGATRETRTRGADGAAAIGNTGGWLILTASAPASAAPVIKRATCSGFMSLSRR